MKLWLDKDGYVLVGDKKRAHILIAEKALGHQLPDGAIVHHSDQDRTNNATNNLVICPDRGYHNLIHRRMRALAECGNADWRKCVRCLKYDSTENLRLSGAQAYHRECNLAHARKMKAAA